MMLWVLQFATVTTPDLRNQFVACHCINAFSCMQFVPCALSLLHGFLKQCNACNHATYTLHTTNCQECGRCVFAMQRLCNAASLQGIQFVYYQSLQTRYLGSVFLSFKANLNFPLLYSYAFG